MGVFLSGGLDSALVASIAATESSTRLKTFTVTYDVGDVGEGAQRPEHLAVIRHRVRRPGEDPALACQGLLQGFVDYGNAPVYHLVSEGALDQGRVHAVVGL